MAFEDDDPTIDCPHCGHTISAQARFCRRCGNTVRKALPLVCRGCGTAVEATDSLFCSKCGATLASSATDSETRPLTVATPVRRSASVEPLPLSSLPERRARKIWPWVFALAILAASTLAVATQRGNLATWLYVSSTPPPAKAMDAAISAYYHAIGNKDFETAYSLWTPSMQKGLAPSDLASQWSSLDANGAQVHLNVSISEPPNGDFVPTTVTETDSYSDGYVRKKVLKGGWHVVNIGGRWLLNGRDFKTVADNGPPPTASVNDGVGSSQTSNAGVSTESGARADGVTPTDGIVTSESANRTKVIFMGSGSAFETSNDKAILFPNVGRICQTYRVSTLQETLSLARAYQGALNRGVTEGVPWDKATVEAVIARAGEIEQAYNGYYRTALTLENGTKVLLISELTIGCSEVGTAQPETLDGVEKIEVLDGPYRGRIGYTVGAVMDIDCSIAILCPH